MVEKRVIGAPVPVVAAVLVDASRRVLVAQRPPGTWQAGKWEFPGGKIEAGESERAALQRELAEELGVQVNSAHKLFDHEHAYSDRTVLLAFWLVDGFAGEARGLEGQALRWIVPAALADLDLLEADKPIVPRLLSAL